MNPRPVWGALWFGLITVVAGAQDLSTVLSGRVDSALVWSPEAGQTGVVTGWAGLVGGTKDVKSELRLTLTSLPTPALVPSRAWVKFRIPGARFTTGLGRLAWGTGFVLVPGDLLFDSVGTDVDFGADELRTQGAWLGDAWVSLGDEAFVEAATLSESMGVRVSAAPWGITVEGAGVWDRGHHTAKAALSTQFHAGWDWYATIRQDFDTEKPSLDSNRTLVGGGAFGLWSWDEFTFTTRHETLAVPTLRDRLRTYHDLTVAWSGLSLTGRAQFEGLRSAWTGGGDLRWGVLQNLSLFAGVTGTPWVLRGGATARW